MQIWSSDFGKLFFQQLLVVEVAVVAVAGDKLVVSSEFDDASTVKNSDTVSIAHGRNPV